MRRRVVSWLWNERTHRARAPWRLLAFVVVLVGLGLGSSVVAPALLPPIAAVVGLVAPGAAAVAVARTLLSMVLQLVVLGGAVVLLGRFVDRRRLRDFGFRVDRTWWADLGFGLLLGAALLTGVFLVEFAAGWVVVTGTLRIGRPSFAFWPWFGLAAANFVVVGVTEELLARGYLLTNLAEGLAWFERLGSTGAVGLALLGSSIVFSASHLANPNATAASATGILVAGVLLGAGYVLTGELAIPIGVHVTWNLFEGPVYGFPVSGVDFGRSVLAIHQHGPAVATGGPFGPEAGLVGVAASLLGVGLVVAWVYRREGRVRVAPSLLTPDRRSGSDREPT